MRRVGNFHLWIGTSRDARDLRSLHATGIEAVVDLAAEEPPAQLSRGLIYLRLPLSDDADCPPWELGMAVWCVERLVRNDVETLVACSAGMSRSPAVVAAALARIRGTRAIDEVTKLGRMDLSPGLWHVLVGATGDWGRTANEGTG